MDPETEWNFRKVMAWQNRRRLYRRSLFGLVIAVVIGWPTLCFLLWLIGYLAPLPHHSAR